MATHRRAQLAYPGRGPGGTGPETPGAPADPDGARWLAGGGEMGDRIRSFDWSATPLGPLDGWPASLRNAAGLCLRSRFQLAVYWGPQLVLLYNDAERDVLAALHPRALGRPAAEILADIWDVVGPMLHGVMATGEATWSVDQPLRINRRGFAEESFFTYSYSPIPDGDGIGGVLLVTFETTERVLAERRLGTLRGLAAETATARSVDEVCDRAAGVLAGNPSDLPFCLLYLTEPDGTPRLRASAGAAPAVDPGRWPLREAAAARRAEHVAGAAGHPPGAAEACPRAAFVLPLVQADKGSAAGCLVVGLGDHRAFDDAYRGFLELVAGQIATAVTGARSFEEERRRAEALAAFDAAKTAFFANVSHEFRTPLTLLLARLEDTLARPEGTLSPADRERLALARGNALRLQKLVNMLLEFSRIEAGRARAGFAPTDLAAFTAELASAFRSPVEGAGLRLVVDCPPLPRPVSVDREMWEKIVLNLLSNAFKFTLEGEITVALRPAEEEPRVEGQAAEGADDHLVKPFSARELLALREARDELEQRVRDRTRELSRANARLARQVSKRKRVEQARTELRRRLVHAQEEEHRRIARELHDDLTQRLAVLAIEAGTLEQLPDCPQEIGGRARAMREQLAALSESVHSLSRQLHPSILYDLGLVDALRSECLSLRQRDGIRVEYRARGVPADLPRGTALCVYRVAQEALRNVAHHARSPRASVRLVGNGRELVLRVRDRGVGFEVATGGRTGLGLESMRERARLIQARLAVRSRPGGGTTVTVRVPLNGGRP